MPVEIIPTLEQTPFFTQRTKLDGRDYILSFKYSDRENRWYVDISDQDGELIVASVKLTLGTLLLGCVVDPRRPPGELMVIHYPTYEPGGSPPEDPGFEDFGRDTLLTYFDAAELGRRI